LLKIRPFLPDPMNDKTTNYITKHLARNVPTNFNEICERVRHRELSHRSRVQRPEAETLNRLYGGMFRVLSDCQVQLSDEETVCVGKRADEILIRFLTLQKTLDQSVPTKPIYKAIYHLNRSLNNTIKRLNDPDRDAATEYLSVEASSMAFDGVFDGANSLAEKANYAQTYLTAVSKDLQKMVDFFDYKNGLAGRGNPSKFALVYALFALADLFENESGGRKAVVNETVNNGENGRRNERRYTGAFLGFVHAFLQVASVDMLQRGSIDGLNDRIRKLAKARRFDPYLYKLLHENEVGPEQILAFMKRADAAK